jgi:hypothetical protein
MKKETATERMARQGGENEVRGSQDAARNLRPQVKKTARPARKSKR